MSISITAQIDGEFAYRIRNPHEPHERIAKEKRTERKSGQPGSLFHRFNSADRGTAISQYASENSLFRLLGNSA
jgi:hypothetical protein